MSLSTVRTVLEAAKHARVATLLWGAPGEGKSSFVRALADDHNLNYHLVLGSIREPTDLAGMPLRANDGFTDLAPPRWAQSLKEQPGLLNLGELTTCTPEMQAAMLGVVLERRVGDITIHPDTWIIADANPPDQAAGGFELEQPMANRFLHVKFSITTEEWTRGMLSNWVTPETEYPVVEQPTDSSRQMYALAATTFVSMMNDKMFRTEEKDVQPGTTAFPSPRTWEMVSRILPHIDSRDTAAQHMAVAGLVGEGAAVEFLTYLANADLPDPLDVLADPQSVTWADMREDQVWAVLRGVKAVAERDTTRWTDAWNVVVAAVDDSRADVGIVVVTDLFHARPDGIRMPSVTGKMIPLMERAGLILKRNT